MFLLFVILQYFRLLPVGWDGNPTITTEPIEGYQEDKYRRPVGFVWTELA